MKRVRKNVARKLFNEGKRIYCVPVNLTLHEWGYAISKYMFADDGLPMDFDEIVNEIEQADCNNVAGRYLVYYIVDAEEENIIWNVYNY